MEKGDALTTAEVLRVFSQEIADQAGTVKDTFDDGKRLFVRSVLPRLGEVRGDDRMQAGVALRAWEGEIWVHPYMYRLVCRNGAIMAQSVASCRVSAVVEWDREGTVLALREAVRGCCTPDVFAISMDQIRGAQDRQADLILNLMPFLSRSVGVAAFAQQIIQRFFDDGDRTRFGLMNAATSVARDTTDPEIRWNLEELGGGIPVDAPGRVPPMPARGGVGSGERVLAS